MKKTFLLLFALGIMLTGNATLIWHESFDKEAGVLNVGSYMDADLKTNNDVWKRAIGVSSSRSYNINVAAGSLSYTGYAAGAGNKASIETLPSSTAVDIRTFADVTSGSTYAAAIINVTSATADADYFLGFIPGPTSTTYMCRVFAKAEGTGFKLGVAKGAELKTDANFSWTTETYTYGTSYLLVWEYKMVSGTKNDICNIYVNPTKGTTTPTLTANQTLADTKSDQNYVSGIFIRESSYSPTASIDEITVATTWAELGLPEGGAPDPKDEPIIVTDDTKSFDYTYTGETYIDTLLVLAENLTEDITVTHTNSEITLSTTTLDKDGGELIITLNPVAAGQQYDTITYTSGTATYQTIVGWYTTVITNCATIAELKTALQGGDAWTKMARFNGNAIVTKLLSNGNFYIQDDNDAVLIDNEYEYWSGIAVGDLITGFNAYNGETAWGTTPVLPFTAPTVISHDVEATPTTVTATELSSNLSKYQYLLVKVENVTFVNSTYGIGQQDIKIDGTDAKLNITEVESELKGKNTPSKAEVTGFSLNANSIILSIRTTADIVDKGTPTALPTNSAKKATRKVILGGQVYIQREDGSMINILGK